ncbi:MAG TPA: PAS domain S-box protein [Desulfonatronum sp.]|nr:PAS domain S-box protein [Desulfonatronum sp.]
MRWQLKRWAEKASKTSQRCPAKEKNTDSGDIIKAISRLKDQEQVLNFENRYRCRDGSYRWIEWRSLPIKDLIYAAARDITDRKRMEEALLLTQFAMDQAPDSILWIDEDGRVIYANNTACSWTGYARDELLSMKIFELDPDFPVEKWEHHKINLKQCKRMSFEGRHRTKDGRFFPVEVVTNYIEDKGRFLGIAFDRDISDRKRLDMEREKLQSQLLQAQKMESVGILAGGVAHDFNNLLHAMRGNIELLAQSISLDPRSASRLQTVTKSMDRAAILVQQLLVFGRKTKPRKMRVDLNHEVREVARMLNRTIPKMIALEPHLDPAVWPLSADPVQIEQILLNLASNAVDAMPDGGKLVVKTSNAVLDDDFVRPHPGSAAGPHVLLTVTDTGCGMDRETLEHIFDPFFTTKEAGKGTGLGLASVYGIVKAHGGFIQCSSEPGRGTTFKVYLPFVEQDDVASQIHPETSPQVGSETILVVDDEQEIRELTQEALESLGYTVKNAANGEQALEIYRQQGKGVDLILLDLNMPGMGGCKCLQELLQLDPAVKVLIASGYLSNGPGKDALAFGAKGFIGKPYQLKKLETMVRQVLDEKDVATQQG